MMKRRTFITLLGGAAAWPLGARAQQAAMPVIGFLHGGPASSNAPLVEPFRRGLAELGYVEGSNVKIEFRWAEGQYDRLAQLAADLVRRQVAVIAAFSPPAAQAAKAATATIPIVFVEELLGKRLGLLHELVPTASMVAVLLNPRTPSYEIQSRDVQAAARTLGQEIHIFNASTEQDVDKAFTALVELRAGALLVGSDPFLAGRLEQMVALAAHYSVPAIYARHEFVTAGGLMSYDVDFPDAYRQSGIYVGRILKGAKPGDLPVVRPTKYTLAINLKTAKTLGLTVPPGLIAAADKVIE